MEVVGSNYPPPPFKVAMSKLVSFGTMGAVATTFFGEKMFEMLGTQRPEFVVSMQNNKMSSCMGAWFLGNTVSQNLLNTGAFEVYYDGEVIFSKLEEKRLPNIPEIIRSLDVAKLERASPRGGGGAVEPEAISDVERNPF
mmetsp:Transcript_37327/g.59961  ORF Transcript_37327/g.59961 Transcript_37327/m.59961 type:complete len:140 (-) Transcript_37327:948-1367(-)